MLSFQLIFYSSSFEINYSNVKWSNVPRKHLENSLMKVKHWSHQSCENTKVHFHNAEMIKETLGKVKFQLHQRKANWKNSWFDRGFKCYFNNMFYIAPVYIQSGLIFKPKRYLNTLPHSFLCICQLNGPIPCQWTNLPR